MNTNIEKIKDKALNLIIEWGMKNYGGEPVAEIYKDYISSMVKYPEGTEVWYLDGLSVCHCKVSSVSFNCYDIPIYKIRELTGRTVTGRTFADSEWISESEIFPTREALVGAYKKILGL